MAEPIARTAPDVVPFLTDRLAQTSDDLAIRDIVLVFSLMRRLKTYDVRENPPLKQLMADRVGGAVAWTRTLGLEPRTEVRGVVPDGTGGVVIAGSFEHQPDRWTLFVAPVTAQGGIGEPIVIGEARVRDVLRLDGRGYVVISDDENVLRLDRAMRLQWRRHVDGVSAAMGLDDGSIVLVGATTRDRTETRLQRLNSQGEVLWDRRWSPGLCPGPAIAVWRSQDDEMIVAGESCEVLTLWCS